MQEYLALLHRKIIRIAMSTDDALIALSSIARGSDRLAAVAERSPQLSVEPIGLRRRRVERKRNCSSAASHLQLNADQVVPRATRWWSCSALQRRINARRLISTTHPQREMHTRHSPRRSPRSANAPPAGWHFLCIAKLRARRERRRNVARLPAEQRENESKTKGFRAAVFAPDDGPALESAKSRSIGLASLAIPTIRSPDRSREAIF
ncbi:hypothetical protein [Bradyrhizobium sp. USDA 3315]